MERNQMDLAVHEVHDQTKGFLKICSNASLESVADVVMPSLEETFKPNRYEYRILREELTRAYARATKEMKETSSRF
jgi:hypothetical protein